MASQRYKARDYSTDVDTCVRVCVNESCLTE
jgi:hypothetical protein